MVVILPMNIIKASTVLKFEVVWSIMNINELAFTISQDHP